MLKAWTLRKPKCTQRYGQWHDRQYSTYIYSLCSVQQIWTHPTGNSLMFVVSTLASLASGPACSSQWCHLLEPWWFTGSSCPISSTTPDSSSTVSPNALVITRKEVSPNYVVLFGWLQRQLSISGVWHASKHLALSGYCTMATSVCTMCLVFASNDLKLHCRGGYQNPDRMTRRILVPHFGAT